MKSKPWKTYALWIAIAEGAGLISGLLTKEGTRLYSETIVKPPLSPPAIVFPIAWAILYLLMGIGAARVSLTPPSAARSQSQRLFFMQLGFNFLWSIIFFDLMTFGAAFLWLVVLWLLILRMTLAFEKLDRPAALMQVPYLLWVLFAGYLNLGVWILN